MNCITLVIASALLTHGVYSAGPPLQAGEVSDSGLRPETRAVERHSQEDYSGNQSDAGLDVPEPVHVDIEPAACPNQYYVPDQETDHQLIPVAILGTATLDVRTIDPETLDLNGVAPVRFGFRPPRGDSRDNSATWVRYRDELTTVELFEDTCLCSLDGPDGFEDLIFYIYRDELITSLSASALSAKMSRPGPFAPFSQPDDSVQRPPVTIAGPDFEEFEVVLSGRQEDGTLIKGVNCIRLRRTDSGRAAAHQEPLEPEIAELQGNHPNPFNPATTISFSLSETATVRLEIYNQLGQRIETLADATLEAGQHAREWRAEDYASGIYFYRLTVSGRQQGGTMILLK